MAFAKTLTLTATGTTPAASLPWIVDAWGNPQSIGVNCILTGSATYSVEGAYEDLKPQWDTVNNTVNWVTVANFTSLTASTNGAITGGPYTMLRLLTTSGTGTVTAKFVQTYAGRAT